MTIEAKLDRMIELLEKLAACPKAPAQEAPAPKPEPTTTVEMCERDQIKAELDRMGIAYNGRYGTDRLAKILEEAKAPEQDEEEIIDAEFTMDPEEEAPAPPLSPIPTVEDLKPGLVEYVRMNGKDAAVELLAKFGASKLSDLNAEGRLGLEEALANV